MWYRHFDQAERWESAEMRPVEAGAFRAAIPAQYTATSFPMQYYFEVRMSAERAWLYPGFDAQRANQPYFVVRPA